MMIVKSPKVKYALVPFLAAILGYVLIREDGEIVASIVDGNTPKLNVSANIVPIDWPVFKAEEIALLEPFRTLKQLDALGGIERGLETQSHAVEGPADHVVSEPVAVRAIFQTPSGAAALLGNRVVRVGDLLENGGRVTAIHAHGIEVSEE